MMLHFEQVSEANLPRTRKHCRMNMKCMKYYEKRTEGWIFRMMVQQLIVLSRKIHSIIRAFVLSLILATRAKVIVVIVWRGQLIRDINAHEIRKLTNELLFYL